MPSFRSVSCVAVLIAALSPPDAHAQQGATPSPQSRANALAASFNKSKHVAKEKRGVRKEKYLDVRVTPHVRANPADYSGTYEVEDLGLTLELRVDAKGLAEGAGREPVGGSATIQRTFRLVDAKVEGGLLTGTQVFADGRHERLEGVFVNRSSFRSPSDPGTTEFGLGVTGKSIQLGGGILVTRVFYRPRP
ncbi:MAG TPA: hypothetical protein VNO75_07525 [Gemmatimonadaceae bacterium]|nr:hypothetical protein [Gemmatimonadaceae bacterium]